MVDNHGVAATAQRDGVPAVHQPRSAFVPDLSDMTGILRTPLNQYQAFIEPLVAWLRPRGVNFLTRAFVRDIGLASSDRRLTVNRLDYERDDEATSVAVGPEDVCW